MTGVLPAIPLSRLLWRNALKGIHIETGNFASPSRGGFALFGGQRLCPWSGAVPHNPFIGWERKELERL